MIRRVLKWLAAPAAGPDPNVVIAHYDEDGELSFVVHGGNVRMFVVDERAAGDRVFEWKHRVSAGCINRIIPAGSAIGSADDPRHEALCHRIEALRHGVPHLALVPSDHDGGL